MIFISYAREDAEAALRLVHGLQAEGLPCLLDPTLPHGDAFWREHLAARMAACRMMVTIDSPGADASPWVDQERRGFEGIGPVVGVPATGDGTALDRIRQVWRCRVRATAGGASAGDDVSAGLLRVDSTGPCDGQRSGQRGADADAAAQPARETLRRHSEAQLAGWLARARPPVRAECDGRHAWLADGRIALVRLPDGTGPDGLSANASPVAGRAGQFIATLPLSNALYRAFLTANPEFAAPPTWQRAAWAADDLPVTGLTWYEATACAAWYGGELPLQADWQWAAQGGRAQQAFATADGTLSPALAHHGAAFASGQPLAAPAHPASPGGFHGLCGNTWDWCADAWGPHRVLRGGGWMDSAEHCRADARYRNAPLDRDACVGMRLAWRPTTR